MLELSKPNLKSIDALPFWRQLRWNLMLFFVALAIIPTIVVTFVLLREVESQNRESIFVELETISLFKTQEIETWLARGQEIVELLVENSEITDSITLAIIDQNTQAVGTVNGRFNEIATASEVIDDLYIYNLDGNVILASSPVFLGRQVARQSFFEPSIADDGFLIHPPFYDVSTQELILLATTPIVVDGTTIGVVAARFNVQTLSDVMLERTGLGETGETYLVSLENNYLLTPSRSEGYPLNRAYRTEGINAALRGENGSAVYADYRTPAQTVYGVYTWIPELEVAFLTELSEAEALTPIREAQNVIMLITALIALVAGSIGIVYALRVSRPIIALTSTASQIAEGNLGQRVSVTQKNEIGALGQAFNQMASAIEYRDKVQIAKLVELNGTLEERLVEVQKARESAEQADKVKSAFLASMSHELRTPLNAVINFSKFIAKGVMGTVNERQEETLGKIIDSGQHLLNLINDVLDISKIESGSLKLFVEEDIRVNELIERAMNNSSVLLEDKPVRIESEISPDLPPLTADKKRIYQIVLNILSNACKFTNEGYVKVRAYTQDDEIRISVEDTGSGIAEADRDDVFEVFKQTTTGLKQGGGTGLGMPISKSLAEAHGGRVWFDSEEGKGTTFYVALPIKSEIAELSLV